MTAWKRFEAEVLFLNPDEVPRAIAALANHGLEFELDFDAIDDLSNAVFGEVSGVTELNEDEVGDFVARIVEPLGGDVVQWGYDRA